MALGAFRRHKRWLYVFLWIVIGAFIILYIPAFTNGGAATETLARVGTETIGVNEFQRSLAQMRQQMGRVDPAMLRQFHLDERVFQSLVDDRLVQLEARRLGVTVTDGEVARAIQHMPGLQDNGQFVGAAEYRRRLEMQGRSVGDFEEAVRGSLVREKLMELVAAGVGPTPAEVEREFRTRNEQLKAEYVKVDAEKFRPQVTVADEDVKARFEQKKDAYRIPEKRVVSYVVIDVEALRPRASVTDAEMETYYHEHEDEFHQPESACTSHILFKVKSTPEAEGHAEADAKKLAEQAKEQLRNGADFAALAKKLSEDKGTAERGGDNGCYQRGQMTAEYDRAAFALTDGAVSDPVKTIHGYHLIKLNSIQPDSTQPFGQVKERIRAQLTMDKVQALLEQRVQAAQDQLRKGKGLDAVAKDAGLTVKKSGPIAKGETPPHPLNSPAIATRAFALKPGEVDRDGVPVGGGEAFISLAEIQPARDATLADVQEKVKADLVAERASDKAREKAAELKARAQKDGLDKAATALGLVRKETSGLVPRGQPLADLGSGQALDEAAYALDEKALSDPIVVSGGWAIVRVLEKKTADPAELEKQREQIAASLREQQRNAQFQSYMAAVRERVPVERNTEVFSRVAAR